MIEVSNDPGQKFNQILHHISHKLNDNEDFSINILIEISNVIFDNVIGLAENEEEIENKKFKSTTFKFKNIEELKEKIKKDDYIGLVKFYKGNDDCIHLQAHCFNEKDIPEFIGKFKERKREFTINTLGNK